MNKDIHIECIKPNTLFMEENLRKAKLFFEVAVLPELLGRRFSRPSEKIAIHNSPGDITGVPQSTSSPTTDEKYCYYQKGEDGKMVECDNKNCVYQWFHLECL